MIDLSCQCGARFKTPAGEARHRHNFPALCRLHFKPARQRDIKYARGEEVTITYTHGDTWTHKPKEPSP